MPDIIQLLPDAVANQIAAGEVVQRPASAVKELLENAVDAGAENIQLIIKDAGKTLIQVIDDGCGMSETDARMSLERHATSKIKKAEELWQIRTKGFRGEALASIAAISHMEMRSRLRENEIGTKITIAGSEIGNQEPCAAAHGTSISVKNLFYNTPARRNFLKSDAVEMRHIVEEFERVALAHPDIGFSLHHNDNELFNLKPSTLRQRIVNVFGSKFNERLVPVKEDTAIVRLEGFIGKPEYAKKTRGEQYFFVNDRFIKNSYLNHAVTRAFDELIGRDSYPSYFLYLKVDPASIDVNIHPTKTELKFTEERSIYAIVHSSVRNSLGKYNIAPSLDFDQEAILNIQPLPQNVEVAPPESKDFNFNPFETKATQPTNGGGGGFNSGRSGGFSQNWKELYSITEKRDGEEQSPLFDREEEKEIDLPVVSVTDRDRPIFQLHRRYILTQIKSGFIIIDQQRAHERVLFEEIKRGLERGSGFSQQQLFPQRVELDGKDLQLLEDLKEDLFKLGFNISTFDNESAVVNGVPAEAKGLDVGALIQDFLEQYKSSVGQFQNDHHDQIAAGMARSLKIKEGKKMENTEMLDLVDRLFACAQPQITPSGKSVILNFTLDEIQRKFKA
ncbi:DNA mismatch repair endonuclease MutL [Cryomorphaceae bacterium 1068]|nr:DNA mismatch repair endonuclease MutL [Cryomorphaceae bacterium 1068]